MFYCFLKNKNQIGFTLVELIVAIAIIAVLSSIIVFAVQNYIVKAKGTRIAKDFKSIETALRLLKSEQSKDIWPRENTQGWFTTVKNITGIGQFLSTSINSPITGSDYLYDNDGDTLVQGSCSCCAGVNLGLTVSNCKQYFDIVDKIIDSSDGPCYGKVRSNGTSYSYIYYSISSNENIN